MSTTLEVVRLTVAPQSRAAFLATRPAAIAALREHCEGLVDSSLAELEDAWIDVVRWTSRDLAMAAAEAMPAIPQAATWGARIAEVTEMQHGEVLG